MKTSEVIEVAKRFSKPYRVTNGKKIPADGSDRWSVLLVF
jgi:hypothetical protein